MSATLAVIGVRGHRLFSNSAPTTAVRLVREDQDWAAMRQSASDCLSAFGIDSTAFRAEEIDRDA
jgi:hypothetical protein